MEEQIFPASRKMLKLGSIISVVLQATELQVLSTGH